MFDQFGNEIDAQASIETIADYEWHYICTDLYAAANITTQASKLILYSVCRLIIFLFFCSQVTNRVRSDLRLVGKKIKPNNGLNLTL